VHKQDAQQVVEESFWQLISTIQNEISVLFSYIHLCPLVKLLYFSATFTSLFIYFKTLNTKINLNYIWRLRSYRALNTLPLGYTVSYTRFILSSLKRFGNVKSNWTLHLWLQPLLIFYCS